MTAIPLVVQAPMAAGPSTPELAAAVSNAGGLGFLAAGYIGADAVREEIAAVRALTDRPFGLNILLVAEEPTDAAALEAYAASLRADAERYGATIGTPSFTDDARAEKIAVAAETAPAVVSFAFGYPTADEVERLRAAGSEVWVTVTDAEDAVVADEVGVDALVAQGIEAGGHRGSFDDLDGEGEIGLLALLRLVRYEVSLPLVAAGGIMDAEGVHAARAAGATAVQCGSAFLLCPEAGTSPPHRAALKSGANTALTRAFTGRRARSIVNRFVTEHADAPAGYPQVAAMVNPIRAAARAAGDADGINLWAGQAYSLACEVPAAEVVASLSRS